MLFGYCPMIYSALWFCQPYNWIGLNWMDEVLALTQPGVHSIIVRRSSFPIEMCIESIDFSSFEIDCFWFWFWSMQNAHLNIRCNAMQWQWICLLEKLCPRNVLSKVWVFGKERNSLVARAHQLQYSKQSIWIQIYKSNGETKQYVGIQSKTKTKIWQTK